ncbi:hypothetical protein GR7B_00029 [Vibrio phage vB_VcorM_GR7B]|nr:hypothetical protein GR7B_00029 [Vibrio phage vB_VcorM_GR7B]
MRATSTFQPILTPESTDDFITVLSTCIRQQQEAPSANKLRSSSRGSATNKAVNRYNRLNIKLIRSRKKLIKMCRKMIRQCAKKDVDITSNMVEVNSLLLKIHQIASKHHQIHAELPTLNIKDNRKKLPAHLACIESAGELACFVVDSIAVYEKQLESYYPAQVLKVSKLNSKQLKLIKVIEDTISYLKRIEVDCSEVVPTHLDISIILRNIHGCEKKVCKLELKVNNNKSKKNKSKKLSTLERLWLTIQEFVKGEPEDTNAHRSIFTEISAREQNIQNQLQDSKYQGQLEFLPDITKIIDETITLIDDYHDLEVGIDAQFVSDDEDKVQDYNLWDCPILNPSAFDKETMDMIHSCQRGEQTYTTRQMLMRLLMGQMVIQAEMEKK